jgi:hypothetical protein
MRRWVKESDFINIDREQLQVIEIFPQHMTKAQVKRENKFKGTFYNLEKRA